MQVYQNQMLGRAESEFEVYNPYPVKGDAEMGKDDFLQLLVAQLANQDPLNPMEDNEFSAQLAEFSSLEQLTNISDGVESLNVGTQRQEMLNAVDFIGKEVSATGNMVSKDGSDTSTIFFDLSESASNVLINIFDETGNIVDTIEMGALSAGSYDVNWDGLDYKDDEMPNGVYGVAMAAESVDGQPIMVTPQIAGKVQGVIVSGNSHILKLDDGREVNMLNITTVVNSEESSSDTSSDTSTEDESS